MLKDIPGFEGWYQASIDGHIFSLKSNKYLKEQLKGPKGKEYYYVCLCKNNVKSSHRVSRLIAITFLPNPNNYQVVNHKDTNRFNNSLDNLEWCTYDYNNHYDNRIEKAVETRIKNGFCVKTAMCDRNTHEVIKIFDTTRQAIDYLQIPKSASSNISAVMKGKKNSAYGYWWKKIE